MRIQKLIPLEGLEISKGVEEQEEIKEEEY